MVAKLETTCSFGHGPKGWPIPANAMLLVILLSGVVVNLLKDAESACPQTDLHSRVTIRLGE